MRLISACSQYVNNLKRDCDNTGTSVCMVDFFKSFKKGSKCIRRVLYSLRKSKKNPFGGLGVVKNFLALTGIGLIDESDLKNLYSCWSFGYIPNRFRDFLFKFTNNLLGLNVRTVHFTERVDRGCTFCTMTNKPVRHDETFLHFFYECDVTRAILESFLTKYFNDFGGGVMLVKKLWFGIPPPQVKDKTLLILSVLFIQSQIWEAKLKGRKPSFLRIKHELLCFLGRVYTLNKKIFNNDPSFFISRNWFTLSSHGLH
jgi:hypothetical protein